MNDVNLREKHGENLPNNWLELIENCPYILKDRVANDLLVLLPNIEVRILLKK